MGSMNLKANEPSMEDILASIRRIIADDQEPVDEPDFQETSSTPLKNVLDIAERHVSASFSPEPPVEPIVKREESLSKSEAFQGESSIARLVERYEAEQAGVPAGSMKAASVQAFAQPCEKNPGESIMSRITAAAVSDAFGRLDAVRSANQPQTVEGLMTEMLRPMLKAWLDDNLPALVERLVQAEIERLTRR